MARKKTQGLTIQAMMEVERLMALRVAPDGQSVVIETAEPDLAANATRRTLRLVELATGSARELTPGTGGGWDAAWSPDGTAVAFVSQRDGDGAQLWLLPMAGGEARQLTRGWGGAAAPVWAPEGRRLAFTRQVVESDAYRPRRGALVDPRTGPGRAQVYGLRNPRSSAQIADSLLFRHWDQWRDRRRQHVWVVDVASGRIADVTPGDWDAPPLALGSGRDIAWSPDGKELAFVANPDRVVARSTNNCVFVQRLEGLRPKGPPRSIATTEACDAHPRYSADGGALYYLGMAVPGYEADRRRLKAYDRQSGETQVFLERFDRSPSSFELDGDGNIVLLAEDRGRRALYRLDPARGRVEQLTSGLTVHAFGVLPEPGRFACAVSTTTQPAELALVSEETAQKPDLGRGPTTVDTEETSRPLTQFGRRVASLDLAPVEEFWFEGASGDPVHGFFAVPPNFSRRRRWPLILLIHGGPQGAFADEFHYRWNVQAFAARGACVAALNPRGSTGYGQRFTDQIRSDWGGRAYDDLMRGVDHLLETHAFLDGERLGAAGASFGGFMVNWIAGHTDRFKALVSHDGIFMSETMAYSTEELWFPEYEAGGFPHEKRSPYLKYSPHRFVQNFKTPTLVIQGGMDFRCPISEGLGMFTALQVMGVKSRFLHFPDEGHWIMQPANAEVWYGEVLDWLMDHLS